MMESIQDTQLQNQEEAGLIPARKLKESEKTNMGYNGNSLQPGLHSRGYCEPSNSSTGSDAELKNQTPC